MMSDNQHIANCENVSYHLDFTLCRKGTGLSFNALETYTTHADRVTAAPATLNTYLRKLGAIQQLTLLRCCHFCHTQACSPPRLSKLQLACKWTVGTVSSSVLSLPAGGTKDRKLPALRSQAL